MIQNPNLLNQLNLQKRQQMLREQHLQRQNMYQNKLEEDRKREIEELVNTSVIKNNIVLQTTDVDVKTEQESEEITDETEESSEVEQPKNTILHHTGHTYNT